MHLFGTRNVRAARLLLVAFASLAAPLAAQAQQTVSGRVTANGTSEPLADARVMLVNTSVAATTNAEGRYTLRNVPTGTVDIRVIRVGYQEQKKSVPVTGSTVTVDFTMQPAI